MIIARFYLRIKIHQARRLLTSDVLMGLAWCAGLATSSFDFVAHAKGALEPHIDWTLANYEAPIEEIEYLTKVCLSSVPLGGSPDPCGVPVPLHPTV